MIVGKIDVPLKELAVRMSDVDKFCEYCDSLVPQEYQHVQIIKDNQRYLCCLYLRKLDTKNWKARQRFMDEVMSKCSVVGYASSLIEVGTLIPMCDKNKLQKYIAQRSI